MALAGRFLRGIPRLERDYCSVTLRDYRSSVTRSSVTFHLPHVSLERMHWAPLGLSVEPRVRWLNRSLLELGFA